MPATERAAAVSDIDFFKVWQTSDSVEEVAERLGGTVNSVKSRASKIRKQLKDREPPIKMKRFVAGRAGRKDSQYWDDFADEARDINDALEAGE